MTHWTTLEEASAWCRWNAKLTALQADEERIYRAAGLKLWRERHAAGLDPATGERKKSRARHG